MTSEVEAKIKEQTWERMLEPNGDDRVEKHANFLEADWQWIKQLGMVDEETDLEAEG